jgi:hypothetical protein
VLSDYLFWTGIYEIFLVQFSRIVLLVLGMGKLSQEQEKWPPEGPSKTFRRHMLPDGISI